MSDHRPRSRARVITGFAVVFIGLVAVVVTAGHVHPWFRAHLGDALIVMLLYAAALLACPRAPAVPLALATFALACLVEVGQLWQPSTLQAFRATWLGRMTIGGSFDPLDFAHYAVGCIAALAVDLTWMQRRIKSWAAA